MITFMVDHSFKDDYYYVNDIEVDVDDGKEKERIEKAIEEHELIGYIGYPSAESFVSILGVDKSQIDIETDKIDLY